jgi:hypothetical protein
MYQLNVITEGAFHGLLKFDAEWRSAQLPEASITPPVPIVSTPLP